MHENHSGLLAVRIKSLCQPFQLFFTERARCLRRFLQRIQHEPVHKLGLDKRHLFISDSAACGIAFSQGSPEVFTMIVITESEVDGQSITTQRLEQLGELSIFARLPLTQSAIAYHEHTRRALWQTNDLARRCFEVFRHDDLALHGCWIRGDVRVCEQRP